LDIPDGATRHSARTPEPSEPNAKKGRREEKSSPKFLRHSSSSLRDDTPLVSEQIENVDDVPTFVGEGCVRALATGRDAHSSATPGKLNARQPTERARLERVRGGAGE
jgi:hypothetical protein